MAGNSNSNPASSAAFGTARTLSKIGSGSSPRIGLNVLIASFGTGGDQGLFSVLRSDAMNWPLVTGFGEQPLTRFGAWGFSMSHKAIRFQSSIWIQGK